MSFYFNLLTKTLIFIYTLKKHCNLGYKFLITKEVKMYCFGLFLFYISSLSVTHSVRSDSVTPWTRACQALGKNTGVGNHSLLQGIFLTQGLNLVLPHCGQTLY